MTTQIKIGDKVNAPYYGLTGVVVDIWDFQPAADAHTTYYKVSCDMLTLDTLKPCTEIRSFRAESIALVD